MRVLVVGNGAREDALSWRLAHRRRARRSSLRRAMPAPHRAARIGISPRPTGKRLAQRAQSEGSISSCSGPRPRSRPASATVYARPASRSSDRIARAGASSRAKSSPSASWSATAMPTARARRRAFARRRRTRRSTNGAARVRRQSRRTRRRQRRRRCARRRCARAVLADWYGSARIPGGGSDVLLEERLEGREVSVFALATAARSFRSRQHAITSAPATATPDRTPAEWAPIRRRSDSPTTFSIACASASSRRCCAVLLAEGEQYVGVLYCGLMWTADGPSVIEFNVRFGDPETQVLMPRISGDFAGLLNRAPGAMDLSLLTASPEHCVGVVLATEDYPRSNTPLEGLSADISLPNGCRAFWGASQRRDDSVKTAGGRVLTVTALGDDLAQARGKAYQAVKQLAARLGTQALTYRTDIASL